MSNTTAPPSRQLRRLLVHIDSDSSCVARARVSARIAALHGCELVGIAPAGTVQVPPGIHSAALAISAADAARQSALLLAERRLRQFGSIASASGATAVSAHAVEGDAKSVLLHYALTNDLLVISRPVDGAADRIGFSLLEQLLLHCPRPALVLPGSCSPHDLGKRIIVAWDGSPPAARAAADAMPLLVRADHVYLCAWHHVHDGTDMSEHLGPVLEWLAAHGVNATPWVKAVREPIGDAICATTLSLGADLVVMGVYGHSRWVERVLGGVTRTALSRSPVPLLMSH